MKKRCREEDFIPFPSLPRDLQYLLFSHYLRHADFSQMEMYQYIKYTRINSICILEALDYLRSQMTLSVPYMELIFQCQTVWDFISNPAVFDTISQFYRPEMKPYKFIICDAKNCVIVRRGFNHCVLHNHGVITYYGYIISFEEFIAEFKKLINGRKKTIV